MEEAGQRVWVLVFAPSLQPQEQLGAFVGSSAMLTHVTTLPEAEKEYRENGDVYDLVVIDGQPDTIRFVEGIRARFSGPIVGVTGCTDRHEALSRVGCNPIFSDASAIVQLLQNPAEPA